MKTSEMLDLENEEQYSNEIFQTFDDNGHWGYTRLGFGQDHIGLYLVDLDDCGDQYREKLYVKETLSSHDVINKGIAMKVFEKDEDEIWYDMNNETSTSWEKFLKKVAR
jgi:hypothetical protein